MKSERQASVRVQCVGRVVVRRSMGPIALCAWGLTALTGSVIQWIALGTGIYVVFSWVQSLRARDPVTYEMIFKSKAMIYTMIAFPTISFVTYGVGFWTAPLLLRLHDTSATE